MCHDDWTKHNERGDRGHLCAWVSSACSQCGSYYGAVTASFLCLRFWRLIKSLISAGLPSEVNNFLWKSFWNFMGPRLGYSIFHPHLPPPPTPPPPPPPHPPVRSACVSGHSFLQQVFRRCFDLNASLQSVFILSDVAKQWICSYHYGVQPQQC